MKNIDKIIPNLFEAVNLTINGVNVPNLAQVNTKQISDSLFSWEIEYITTMNQINMIKLININWEAVDESFAGGKKEFTLTGISHNGDKIEVKRVHFGRMGE